MSNHQENMKARCVCGHLYGKHHYKKDSCLELGCGCKRFDDVNSSRPTAPPNAEHFARAIVSEYLGECQMLTNDGFARAVQAAERLLAVAGPPPAALIDQAMKLAWSLVPDNSDGEYKPHPAEQVVALLQQVRAALRGGSQTDTAKFWYNDSMDRAEQIEVLSEALRLIAKQPTHPRQGITRGEIIRAAQEALTKSETLREAMRVRNAAMYAASGGSHQPEEANQ